MANVIARYPGEENTEAQVAEVNAGFSNHGYSATLMDLDANEPVGSVIYRSDRFGDAAARADAAAREMVA